MPATRRYYRSRAGVLCLVHHVTVVLHPRPGSEYFYYRKGRFTRHVSKVDYWKVQCLWFLPVTVFKTNGWVLRRVLLLLAGVDEMYCKSSLAKGLHV